MKINFKELSSFNLYGKIHPNIWAMAYRYTKESHIIIRSKQSRSNLLKIQRGNKQGGPASPKLFNIYI